MYVEDSKSHRMKGNIYNTVTTFMKLQYTDKRRNETLLRKLQK